jgi:uncharacterized protein YdcH (DUF465 family)
MSFNLKHGQGDFKMHLDRSDLIDLIRQENREFRKLEEKHKEYEAQLDELLKHAYLTPNQEMLKQEIKKHKLWTKDRMAEIVQLFMAKENHSCERLSSKRDLF